MENSRDGLGADKKEWIRTQDILERLEIVGDDRIFRLKDALRLGVPTKTIQKLTLARAVAIVEQVKTGLLTIKSQYTILSQGVGQCCAPVTTIYCGSVNATTAHTRTKTGQLTRYGLQCDCCEEYMDEDRWREHTGNNTLVYIEDWGDASAKLTLTQAVNVMDQGNFIF